jgi:hypothetical protein
MIEAISAVKHDQFNVIIHKQEALLGSNGGLESSVLSASHFHGII